MTNDAYVSLDALLTSDVPPPETLDAMTFDHRGVRVHAYGVLHGIGGGATGAYRDFVRRSVAVAPGLVFGEMEFGRFYGPGIKIETDDHLAIPLADAVRMGFRCSRPLYLLGMALAVVREFRSISRFGHGGTRRLADLPGTPHVHRLHPLERRRIRNIPPPDEALRVNLERRRGVRVPGPRFRHPDLLWFEGAEPYANIPLRSVHMLEFSVETALLLGRDEISIFVGDTHQTDIAWYAATNLSEFLDPADLAVVETVRQTAWMHAERRLNAGRARVSKGAYLAAQTAGAAPMAVGIGALISWMLF